MHVHVFMMYLSVYVVYVHVCSCMWLYIYKLAIKSAKYEMSYVYVCASISLYLDASCCMSCDSCLAFFFAVSLGCFHDDVRSEPGSWLVVGMIPVFDKKTDMGKALLSTFELVYPEPFKVRVGKVSFRSMWCSEKVHSIMHAPGPS
jgi:hypothetical protein